MIHFGVGYFWEVPVKLVVLPEYFMQGVGTPGKGESGIEGPDEKGRHHSRSRKSTSSAQSRKSTACTSVVAVWSSRYAEFPGRWFNTNFIVGPSGEVVLKYHKWHINGIYRPGHQPARHVRRVQAQSLAAVSKICSR